MLKTDKDYVEVEPYEFEEEQQTVARILHLIESPEPETTLNILLEFKQYFVKGGENRMKFTIPSFIFAVIKLIRALCSKGLDKEVKTLIKLIRTLIDKISSNIPETAMRLYLDLAMCINEFDEKQEVN